MNNFKKGDPPPKTYNAWHDWAKIQYAAGLRQVRCINCSLFRFPQELDTTIDKPLCKDCAK